MEEMVFVFDAAPITFTICVDDVIDMEMISEATIKVEVVL